jgi:outer membrane protein OmpA-like peptidoglycan-associated protein
LITLRNALLGASMLVAAPVVGAIGASAQPVTGLYLGGAAGWKQPLDREHMDQRRAFGGAGAALNGRHKAQYDAGYVGLMSLGWGFGNGVRTEIEGNFRSNELNKLRGSGQPFSNIRGSQRSYGVMANAFYDLDFANFGLGTSIVQPYIGLGAGYVWDEFNKVNASSQSTGQRLNINDTGARFAYQGIIGAALPLTQFGVRGLSLTAEYRYLGTLEPRVNATAFSTNGTANRGKLEVENMNHSVLIGLRYAFNQAPPPPPPMAAPTQAPAPAAQPARTYLVFFDWDRADLTSRAREIITEAAQNSRRMQVTRIEVAGHSDRSGDAAYNQRLSQRRAEAVAGELVRGGVQRDQITVTAFGESRPLVPTADGVREPQNRRVEIVLR